MKKLTYVQVGAKEKDKIYAVVVLRLQRVSDDLIVLTVYSLPYGKDDDRHWEWPVFLSGETQDDLADP